MNAPKLIISLENKVVEEIAIEKEIITIGRRTDNDLCLDNLAISGYHSQISTVLDDCFLEDLNSTNGTFVNSRIIKKHALKDGDVIDIGNHRIKYVNHLASNSANDEFEKTLIMSANSERNQSQSEEQEMQELEEHIDAIEDDEYATADDLTRDNIEKLMVAKKKQETKHTENKISKKEQQIEDNSDDIEIDSQAPSANVGHIQILNGKNSGKEISLDKSLTTVGKPDIAVVGITKRNKEYFIIHIDGNDETPSKLNGEIIRGKAQPLEDHDIIDVAGIKLEFFVE